MVSLKDLILKELNNSDIDSSIKNILAHKSISNKLRVQFSLYCASDAKVNWEPKLVAASERCLALVERWLVNPASVSKEKLRNAAYAAYYADYDAHSAAAAASSAAAANSVAYAASSAYAAALSFPSPQTKLAQYRNYLVGLLAKEFNWEMLEVLYA